MRVTHPFHPLFGHPLEVAFVRHNWGESRLFYRAAGGHLLSVPARFTSLVPKEPLLVVAAGRCRLRADDLAELAGLVAQQRARRLEHRGRKCKSAVIVKIVTP